MTLQPGLHVGIPMADYCADTLTPEPALSRSGIVTLLEETPAHFRARNPRLSPWPIENDSTKETDLGTIVHGLILGCGGEFCVIDPSDFKNKDGSQAKNFANADAKAAKKDAEERGLIVISPAVNAQAARVAEIATKAILKRYGSVWERGQSEVTMIWRRGDVWCRARHDRLNSEAGFIFDVKTTSKSISNFALASKFAGEGADIQAAHYVQGLESLIPDLAGRVTFVDIVVEVEPPYEVRFVTFPQSTITLCHQIIDIAADKLAKCLRENTWPGHENEGLATLPAVAWREKSLYEALIAAAEEEW